MTDGIRREAARHIAVASLLLGLALPFLLGVVARFWLSAHGRPVVSWREGLVMILLPTVLLVLPAHAVFARVAYRATLRAGDVRRRTFTLRAALGGLALVCGTMLFGLLLEGQVSLLALLVVPFWMACAAGALVGYWIGAGISRFR